MSKKHVKKAGVGDGGERERALDDVYGVGNGTIMLRKAN